MIPFKNLFEGVRPWVVTYSPYHSKDDAEIPAYEVHDADGHKVCDTNEDRPPSLQERQANAIAAIPAMIYALRRAETALNTAPNFRVDQESRIDSYDVARIVERVLKQAGNPF